MRWGRKVNWSMSTSAFVAGADRAASVAAATRSMTPNAVAMRLLDLIVRMNETPASPLQRLVDDGEPLLSAFEDDVGDAENRAQLVVGDLHRARRGCRTRRWLREGGRHGGVEGDVALDLLHDLVDVTVEHRHRAEALEIVERTRRVFRAPPPGRIDRPQRNVREDDDRGRCRPALEVALQPFGLLVPEIAQPAGLEIDHVDEADEVHAVGVEAVPARAFGAATVAVAVELHVLVENIVFARHVMHVEPRLRDDAVGVVEFGRLGEMGDIAGVNDEGWLDRKRIDLVQRFLERADSVRVRRLVESDMAVADLQEGQPTRFDGPCLADNAHRARDPAGDGPQDAGTGPGHAFENFAPADAALVVVIRSHRQSPLKPGSLARIRSGISKIYSSFSRRPFFRTCNDQITWSFKSLTLEIAADSMITTR